MPCFSHCPVSLLKRHLLVFLPEIVIPSKKRILELLDGILAHHGNIHLTKELKEAADHLQMFNHLLQGGLSQTGGDHIVSQSYVEPMGTKDGGDGSGSA